MASPADRRSALLVSVLAIAALVAALLAAPAAHADELDDAAQAHLEAARALTGGAVPDGAARAGGGHAYASTAECISDPTGDTVDLETGDPGPEPRADIVESCVSYGPTVSVAVAVDRPTDPETDGGWQGATFVGWFVDITDDGEGEFFIGYHLDDGGELVGYVSDVRGDAEELVCEATPSHTPRYAVSDIPRDCLDNPAAIAVSALVMYDTTPGEEGGVFVDAAPDFDAFGPATEPADRATTRLAGPTRIETAVAISGEQFPEGSEIVYVARADLFADAVAGGVLTDGPILLVHRDRPVPQAVLDEIARLDPSVVIALGGPVAVPDERLAEAGAGRATDRLAGADREETSVRIAERAFPAGSDVVYLARRDLFADAVVGGVLTDGPILLVPREGAPPQLTLDAVNALDPDVVLALGGPDAIGDATLEAAAQGRPTGRVAGPTRFETAVAISQRAFPGTAPDVYISRSDIFADSTVGGVLTDGPILLVQTDVVPIREVVAAEISRVAPSRVVALGGPEAVADAVLADAAGN